MFQYPKQILTIPQQVKSYDDAGMVIPSRENLENALKSIGFYMLKPIRPSAKCYDKHFAFLYVMIERIPVIERGDLVIDPP